MERKCERDHFIFLIKTEVGKSERRYAKKWSDEQNDKGLKGDCSTRPVQSDHDLLDIFRPEVTAEDD